MSQTLFGGEPGKGTGERSYGARSLEVATSRPDPSSSPKSASPAPAFRSSADVPPFEYWATPVEPGRTLVEASAGTGKTFAIAGLVLRLVLEGDWLGATPDLRRLLVVTFTNAATEELRTRIRGALRGALEVARGHAEPNVLTEPLGPLLALEGAEDRLLAALDRVDEAGVFTIHGFCKRVLEQAAFESGTPFEMEFVEDADSDALRRRAAADAWARLTHADPTLTAVALLHGRTPDALRADHKAVSDFPSVRILPETDLEAARADLEAARRALADAWDADAVRAALEDVDWNKDAPLDGADAADRVAAFARGEDPDALQWALAHAPDAVAKHARKTGGDGRTKAERADLLEAALSDPGLEACGALEAAAAALDLAFTRAFVLEVDAQIAAIKERRSQLTFADLIERLHDALHDPATADTLAAGIRRQFSVALIDEFQDTDPLQYAIFRTAFEGVPLYFVGDPKQAIYAFRGADVHAYLGAQSDADRVFTLGTNWRSTAGLVQAVNAVFAAPSRAFLFEGIPFRPVASSPDKQVPRLQDGDLPPLVWWPTPLKEDGRPLGKGDLGKEIPPLVATEIARLLGTARMVDPETEERRAVGPKDIAVLVPSRWEAAAVLEALQALRVPAVVSRANDVRESAVMADVELVLRAVLRPDDERARRAALATELWGWSAHDIAALDEAPDLEAEVVARLRAGQRQWRRTGVLGVLVEFQHAEGVVERLLGRPDGERMVTDLRHVAEMLHEIETSGARSPEDVMHWVRHRNDQALPSREMKELRLERDADAVTITTHHNSKGLEYEIVFLPYLWSLSQRDYQYDRNAPVLARTPDGVVYDLGSDDHEGYDRMRQADALAENVRKAYVAMTRARERCYVVWGRAGAGRWRLENKSSLGYLLAGHRAPHDGSLADHVEAARAEAQVDNPFDAVRALEAEGAPMRIVPPPRPGSVAPRAAATSRAAGAAAALEVDARDRIASPWARASFTAWTSGASDGLAASDEPETPAPRVEAEPAGLHAFAAGAGPGTCLHEILQYAAWSDTEDARTANHATIANRLQQHGLDKASRHRAPIDPALEVERLVERIATAPLFGATAPRDLEASSMVAEWDFTVPLGAVAPSALAAVFREHGAAPFGPDYAESLARLSSSAIDGFLTGSADLVAQADERWWIVDWKSNRLGNDFEAYGPHALEAAMREHHYGLQLHLYTLGLHRFLKSRARPEAPYDYETHIGGATYAFLRGLGSETGDVLEDESALGSRLLGNGGEESRDVPGLFTHRPSAALIDALDRLLDA